MARARTIPVMTVSLAEEEIDDVVSVLRSGKLREGAICREFEERFADAVGARHAISVSSGTAALHVAYAAILQPGDEVLVPSFTFIATASMAVMAGGVPVLCDVHPRTFTIDVEDACSRITPRTKAIAPVHLFGNPADVPAVQALSDEFGLRVVWDAAQALGVRYAGQGSGAFDDLVCHSFYPSKNITTGEGGMITTNDDDLAARCRLLRSHGASGKYHHTILGFNYRLTDVMAALGIRQLEKLDGWVSRRRQHAAVLTQYISELQGVTPPMEQPGGSHCFNLFTVLVDPALAGCDRDELAHRLSERGVETAVHYPKALHDQPALSQYASGRARPVSDTLTRQVLALPSHPGLDRPTLDVVGAAVRDALVAAP